MQKRILVPNGNYTEENIIKIYREMGLYVITSGNAPGLSGHKYADEYVNHDYSDKDGMLRIAQEKQIDYISSCANDFGVLTAAWIAERMGLPGHDTFSNAQIIAEKDRFKKFAQENDLLVIPSVSFDDPGKAYAYVEVSDYPLIIKPTDLSGGKGITRADSVAAAKAAVEYAFQRSKAKHIVIEPFITGTQHSISTFLLNEKVAVYGTINEYGAKDNPFLVGADACPADISIDNTKILISQIEKIASLLHLSDGIFHVQFIIYNGKPLIMECMRRILGNHCLEEVQMSTGIDWERWIAKCYCGQDCSEIIKEQPMSREIFEKYIQAPKNGTVQNLVIDRELQPFIRRLDEQWHRGMKITDHATEKLAFLFLEFPERALRNDVISRIDELVKVEMA